MKALTDDLEDQLCRDDMTTYIDPPSGLMYGFPKALPEDFEGNLSDWLVENGYPQEEVDKWIGGVPCGMWEE